MAGKASSGRSPVKTGAHGAIERQLGAPPLSSEPEEEPPDFDRDLDAEGYQSVYQQHRQAQATERRTRARALRAPASPRSRPAAPRTRARSSRPAPSRSRRTTRPSLGDPTGGRVPFLSFDGNGIAGVFFGAIVYSLIISVADYGAQGPLLWFKAKFLNQAAPAKGTAPLPSSGSSSSSPSLPGQVLL